MATTNLIVDFLVIGIAGFVWLGPILAVALGNAWIDKVLNLGTGGLPFVLGFAYILGISISRLADEITDWANDKWRDDVFGKTAKPSYHNQLNYVISHSESASEYLGYRRSIIRTSRACAVNFLLGSTVWIGIASLRPTLVSRDVAVVIAIIAATMSAFLFRAWATVLRGYFHSIKDIYDSLD